MAYEDVRSGDPTILEAFLYKMGITARARKDKAFWIEFLYFFVSKEELEDVY